MTSSRRFINEVDEPHVPQSSGNHSTARNPSEVTLDAALLRKSNTLMPSYVPTGYELSRVNISHDSKRVMLVYGNEDSDQHGHLVVVQGGSLSSRGFQVKAGYAQAVSVQSGDNGHVVRGGWTRSDPRNASSDLAWDPAVATTVFFERSEGLILLRGEPASAWPESELKRVAESLGAS